MRVRASIVAGAAALVLAGGALGGGETTQPSKFIRMTFLVRDTGIQMGAEQGVKHHGDLVPLAGPVPRGDYLSINVLNLSKSRQQFFIMGRKTPVIKAGGKAHLFMAALQRGIFPFRSTTANGKKTFRGFITVA
jgi:hypothetical protein